MYLPFKLLVSEILIVKNKIIIANKVFFTSQPHSRVRIERMIRDDYNINEHTLMAYMHLLQIRGHGSSLSAVFGLFIRIVS